jgi:hypothetical protein
VTANFPPQEGHFSKTFRIIHSLFLYSIANYSSNVNYIVKIFENLSNILVSFYRFEKLISRRTANFSPLFLCTLTLSIDYRVLELL